MTLADDERALRALALAYAHHADRGEPQAVAELFEPDATLQMVWRRGDVAPAVSRGRRQIAKAIGRLRQYATTLHLVANHTVTVDGDEGRGEVYCTAHHLTVDDGAATDHVMFIRYLDRYRRDGGIWRFAERETTVEWTEERSARP
jgi:hypothetical protein